MAKEYEHLSLGERALIEARLRMGYRLRAIATSLQRAPSTISRELKRCGWQGGQAQHKVGRPVQGANGYACEQAHRRACQMAAKPRVTPKLVVGSALWHRVMAGLKARLSPRQIAGTLRRMDPEAAQDSALPRISHETIYSAIYAMPKGQLRSQVIELLRKGRKGRRPRTAGTDRRGLIVGMHSIEDRPLEVQDRLVPGHWEGDLIKGAFGRSQVGTLVERKTLFTLLAQVPQATAACTAKSFASVLRRVDAQMRLSLTYDQGKEMAAHRRLSKAVGIKVYFAHPHSPWERGINENTNGLLRQYLPKASDLGVYSQAQLDAIAFELNARPRQSLGWKCPAELFLPEGSFDFKAYWADKLGLPSVALGT